MHTLFAPKHGIELWLYIAAALVIGAGLLLLLCQTPQRLRKPVIAFVTFLGGLYFTLEFLIPHDNYFTHVMPEVVNAEIVVSCFTLFIGIYNLFGVHGRAIRRKQPGWYNSVAFFVSFFLIASAGFIKDMHPDGAAKPLFEILFNGFMNSLQATTFSLIAFYIVSAAYRAFRIRNSESVLMMVTAVIIMLGLVPLGSALTSFIPANSFFSFLRLEKLSYFILLLPNMAVQRAIAFGVGVGSMAMGLRIWLSLERGSFFDEEL